MNASKSPRRSWVAPHIAALPRSGIRDFFELVSQMDEVISLGIGEPDFVTPWNIREAAIYGLTRGVTHYTSNLGDLRLRKSICRYFRPPGDGEKGEFYTATDILGHIGGNPALRMTIEKIGSAMKALGYRQYRSHGRRGYRVVPYKPDEIEMNRRMLAGDARPDDGYDVEEGDRGDS